MVKFSVTVEDENGQKVALFTGIPAQTKSEAINRAKQALTFTAQQEYMPPVSIPSGAGAGSDTTTEAIQKAKATIKRR